MVAIMLRNTLDLHCQTDITKSSRWISICFSGTLMGNNGRYIRVDVGTCRKIPLHTHSRQKTRQRILEVIRIFNITFCSP